MEKWKGTFWSTTYSFAYFWTFVSGEVELDLDPGQKEYFSTFRLKYTGKYRNGEQITGNVRVSGSIITLDLEGMMISFMIQSQTPTAISGNYGITQPFDQGTFKLYRL